MYRCARSWPRPLPAQRDANPLDAETRHPTPSKRMTRINFCWQKMQIADRVLTGRGLEIQSMLDSHLEAAYIPVRDARFVRVRWLYWRGRS